MVSAACSVINKTYVSPEGPISHAVEEYPLILDSTAETRAYVRDSVPIVKKIEYYRPPEKIRFKLNGTCIYTFTHPGSDSGPVDYQHKGNYSIEDNKIEITFTQMRSIGRISKSVGKTINDMDWKELNSYEKHFFYESNRDTIWQLGRYDEKGLEYIKK